VRGYLPRKQKKLVRTKALAKRMGLPLRTTANSQYQSENVAQYQADVRNLRRQNTVGTNGYYKPPYGNAHSLNEATGKEKVRFGGERAGYRDYLVTTEVRPLHQSITSSTKRAREARVQLNAVERRLGQMRAEGPIKRLRNRGLIKYARGRESELRRSIEAHSDSINTNRGLLIKGHVNKLRAIKNAKKPKLPQ